VQLTRREVDVSTGFVTVLRNQAELNDGRLVMKDPKSVAGRRTVPIPDELLDDLKRHLELYAEPGESGRVFVGAKGGTLRRQNFRKLWVRAVAKAKVPAVHFHDLRHTGNTLAAENGATLRELMDRMGHSSSRAALIYLHVWKGRARHIADTLSAQIKAARAKGDQK
jgi:integrase